VGRARKGRGRSFIQRLRAACGLSFHANILKIASCGFIDENPTVNKQAIVAVGIKLRANGDRQLGR
jgi:hypothetical protein